MSIKCGYLGTGNMGSALAKAAVKAIGAGNVYVYNRTLQKAAALSEETGAHLSTPSEICADCDFIFLGVKPQNMHELIGSILPYLRNRNSRFILVSMAAGLTIDDLTAFTGDEYPVIRIMPNLPVRIGQGMTTFCSKRVTDSELSEFKTVMSRSGILLEIDESKMDAASSVAGCGPAFAAMFMEALSDGGVRCGLSRNDALTMAAQMMLGTAQCMLEEKILPEEMKDAVCSPGGTTIEGVAVLEENGMRSAVIEAVYASTQKSKKLT